MSLSHLIILGIIALIVIPPEKLPEMARQFAKLLFELKRSADQIMGELKQEAMFKPEDIIDQNIKNKLAEIQNQLKSNVNNINQNVQNQPHAPVHNSISEMSPSAAPVQNETSNQANLQNSGTKKDE